MKHFKIFMVIILIAGMASSGCFIPEEPVQDVDLSKSPPKPPMDLDKPPPEEVSLIERMGYEDKDVIYAAYDELIAMGENAVPILVEEGLKHEDPGIRDASASTLGKIGPDAAGAVPALIEALDDEYSQIRLTAMKTLGLMGPAAKEAIPALIDIGKEDTHGLGKVASGVLGKIGPDAVPPLLKELESKDYTTLHFVMLSFKKLELFGEDAVPALVEMLLSTKPREGALQVPICEALVGIGTPSALQGLIEVLKSDGVPWQTRSKVISSIGEFGRIAVEAVPLLLEIYEGDADKWHAKSALGKIGVDPGFSIARLLFLLQDDSPIIRGAAAFLIGDNGADGEPALESLKEIAENDPVEDVQFFAEDAIRRITEALITKEK